MQGMRLEYLPVVQQSPQFVRDRRQVARVEPDDLVDGFGRRQVMAYRANATEALHQQWRLPVGVPLNKPLEPAEFNNVEKGVFNFILFIQVNGYFTMAFNSGYGIYTDFFSHVNRI